MTNFIHLIIEKTNQILLENKSHIFLLQQMILDQDIRDVQNIDPNK